MTHGPTHPDEGADEQPPGNTDPGPFGTWGASETEATFPPRPDFRPSVDDIPPTALEPTPNSSGATPSGGDVEDSIGVQGPTLPGQVLFGRYLAEKLIGEGGMGTVWLVKHLELDTLRALKLIVSGIAFDPQAQARFKREARVMARLSHPNAVVVHDARMGRDAAFIEMEYIRGQSLNRLISQGVAMPLGWTTRILEQLCDVLEEAHNQKIVHRDLKPANLMLLEGRPVGREQLKVLDFGIAKILGSESEAGDVHTHTGCFLGSAPYTSPEQACGTEVDGRSDIYSVGVILYELLTGHRPFTGPITRLVYDHLYSTPPPFLERNPACRVPPEIERVVQRCLAKNPDDRPQSGRALFEEFRRAIPEGYRDDDRALPPAEHATEPDPGSLPRTLPSSWAAAHDQPSESHTRGLAEDTGRFHQQGPPPSPSMPPGYPLPPKPAYAPPMGPTDWGQESYAPAKPDQSSARRRRRVFALVAVFCMVAVAGLAALAGLAFRRPSPPPGLKGYRADPAAGMVGGYPSVLVRERDQARFHRIDGGPFKMGNSFDRTSSHDDEDQPPHPVELSDYYIQETEVTNAEIEAYFREKKVAVNDRPTRWRKAYELIHDKQGIDPARYPAVGISHRLAEEYARWVGGRLPTEAEWEYSARSRGLPNTSVWGTEPKPNKSMANIDTLGIIGTIPTRPVGSHPKDRTAQGVLDLTGNVREWCHDLWAPYINSSEPVRDPKGPAASKSGADEFVIRGGSFRSWADKVRTTRPRRPEKDEETSRMLAEDGTADDVGFRVVLEWPRP